MDAFPKVLQFWPQMLAEATVETLSMGVLSPYRVLATIWHPDVPLPAS